MTLIAHLGALLLQGATAAPETTLVRNVTTGPEWYTILQAVLGAVTTIVFLVLMVILIPVIARLRKTAERFEQVLGKVERSIDPVTTHAARIADNVDYVTTAVRTDVQELRRTLHDANAGVRTAIDATERRMQELGALLRLVQNEAEHAFVSTAATLRGVQAGASSFRERDAATLDDDEVDDLDDLDDLDDVNDVTDLNDLDDVDDDLDAADDAAEEMDDGYDNGPAFERAEPRIKRPERDKPR
jgi:uncharacterized protein YoxC